MKLSGIESQLIYRRPVAWMLLRERSRAQETLQGSLARMGDRKDPAAQEFRRFGEALGQRLETSS